MRHLITVLLFVWTIRAQAQIIIQHHPPIAGKVTRVIDGDTYEVAYNFRTTRWRIQGVDTPEKDQPFGHIALDSISKILIGKKVDGFCFKKDLYQRIIVKITKIESRPCDLDSLIIANGWGWSRIGWHGTTYNKLEDARQAQAITQQKGLWACTNPVPPKVWRKLGKRAKRLANTCH